MGWLGLKIKEEMRCGEWYKPLPASPTERDVPGRASTSMHGASWLLCGFGRWWGKVPDNFSFPTEIK